jgi:hypothetical protein
MAMPHSSHEKMDTRGMMAPRWIGAQELDEFWARLWSSDKGRQWSLSTQGLAPWLKERLRQRPFFYSQPWSPALQRRHFSQMWGQVFARSYDNPAVADLYWIHELCHWACADLSPSRDFEQWCLKWDLNELRASCASEILVHGEVHSWDIDAFGRPVWARKFGPLGGSNPLREETWSESSRAASSARLAIREGLVEPKDEDERWFASFKNANKEWALVWEGAWRELDQGLLQYGEALLCGSEQGARGALEQAGSVLSFPSIPYQEQAERFAGLA